MKRIFLKTLVAAVALAGFGFAQAQTKTIKFANQNAKGHPIVNGMERFAELVEKNSGGRLKVNVFAGGALGSDQANVSALQGGTLEMASMNSGIFASVVKDFAIYDFPFLFGDAKEADAVVDGPFGKSLHAKLEEKGMVGLAYYELGFRHITNSKRPITKVEDIAGLKLRVIPNPINIDWVSALGANPTPLAFNEVYLGLKTGTIDGQDNPLPTVKSAKFYEVTKQIVLTSHLVDAVLLSISTKAWKAMSADDQRKVKVAAAAGAKFNNENRIKDENELVEFFKKEGLTVTTPDVAAFRATVQKAYLASELSKDWPKGMLERVNAVR